MPQELRRTCAQCCNVFAAFEGGQCSATRPGDFLCALCWGGYIMRACSEGGSYETETTDEEGVVISARGRLPCPLFHGHSRSQLVARSIIHTITHAALDMSDSPGAAAVAELEPHERAAASAVARAPARGAAAASDVGLSRPASPQLADAEPEPEPESEARDNVMDCPCGAVPMAVIETILLDPRNTSAPFWRMRHADTVMDSHAALAVAPSQQRAPLPPGWTMQTDEMSGRSLWYSESTGELLFEPPPPLGWSRKVELLGRGYTPANVHETAMLRVALADNSAVAAELQALQDLRGDDDQAAVAVAAAKVAVIEALDRGGSLQCPQCGVKVIKDDACIHIDSCPCGSKWCFLCGKLQAQCPRGPEGRGCDETSYYLEQHQGWGGFALDGENPAQGAQKEFLRCRQAFLVRSVMEKTDAATWKVLRQDSPELLMGVPTDGRSIDWKTLTEAEYPLFGSRRRNAARTAGFDPNGLVDEIAQADEDAQALLVAHWEQVRLAQEREVQRRRRREQAAREREALRLSRQRWLIPVAAVLFASMVVGTSVMMAYAPPPTPVHAINSSHPEPEPEPLPEPEFEPGSELREFECNWTCTALVLVPQVQCWLGAGALAVAALLTVFKIRIVSNWNFICVFAFVLGIPLYCMAAAQPRDLVTSNFFFAYFLTPFCAASAMFWLSCPMYVLHCCATNRRVHCRNGDVTFHVDRGGLDDFFDGWVGYPLLFLLCGAMCHVMCMIIARVGDDVGLDLIRPEPVLERVETQFMTTALRIIPLGECALSAVVGLIWLITDERVRDERVGFIVMIVVGSAVAASIIYWPVLLSVETFATGNPMTVYVIAPLCLGLGAPAALCFAAAVLAFSHDIDDDIVRAFCTALTALHFPAYVAAVVYTRNWVLNDVNVAPDATYERTWPCVALRYLCGASMAASAVSLLGVCRRRDHERVLLHRVPMPLLIAAHFAVVVMTGWPLLMSVLSVGTIVTGTSMLYALVPAAAVMGFGGSWMLLQVERNQDWPEHPAITAISLTAGSASLWPLFVLRHSIDPVDQWDQSRQSWVLFWEVLGIVLISLTLLLCAWSTPTRWADEPSDAPNMARGGAKGLRRSTARCGLLWLPASAWVAVAFVVDHSYIERWFTFAIGGSDGSPARMRPHMSQILIACGITITILGVAYDELRVYDQEHSAVPERQQLCSTCARSLAWLCLTLALAGATFFATLNLLANL